MKKKYKQPEGGLLQSEEWTRVLRADANDVIDVSDRDTVIFGTEHVLPIVGKYIYFPRINNMSDELVRKIVQLECGWIRLDICNAKDLKMLQSGNKKIVQAPHNTQPKENLIIDITKSAESLLSQMKSKTRYNVRLAQRKDVKVFSSKDKKYVDTFYRLVEETAVRKGVTFHDKRHYENILNILPTEMIKLYIAEYDGQIIAINLVSFYGGTATYLHGATANISRNVMAPFLLQWQIIQDAKKMGCNWYDFGGVFSDSGDAGKQGITRFKNGFAPKENFFVTQGSYDIILSPMKYKLYRAIQTIKNKT